MLTDTALRNLKPKEKLYKVTDRDGMYVEVRPTGRLVFRMDYRLHGRRETLVIGPYGSDGVSLAEARERCIAARKMVKEGLSPAQEKQREKRRLSSAQTFGEFAEAYFSVSDRPSGEPLIRDHEYDAPVERLSVLQKLPVRAVSLSGEFGRRIDAIINQNILAIDLDAVFLAPFRERVDKGYVGFGKFIDAVSHLAATTGDPRLVDLKQRAVDGLIATQEPDGYIGIIKDRAQRVQCLWDLHEGAYLIWGLLSDHVLFENAAAFEAAKRLADFLVAQVSDPSVVIDSRDGLLGFEIAALGLDRALVRLFKLSGDDKYLDFAKRVYGMGVREKVRAITLHRKT